VCCLIAHCPKACRATILQVNKIKHMSLIGDTADSRYWPPRTSDPLFRSLSWSIDDIQLPEESSSLVSSRGMLFPERRGSDLAGGVHLPDGIPQIPIARPFPIVWAPPGAAAPLSPPNATGRTWRSSV
jgi:hypothetical protein